MPSTMMLPPPPAFGLPAKFADWYPDQVEAISQILDSPTRFVGLTVPTGGGKSLIYMGTAHMAGGRWVALTAERGLQDQVSADFSEIGVVDVRGQSNYPCLAYKPHGEWASLWDGIGKLPGCDTGPCHFGLPCSLRESGCAYYDRVRKAINSDLVISNYALALARAKYGDGMGHMDGLVLDEAHLAPDELSNALTVTIEKWLLQAVGIKAPDGAPLSAWISWAQFHLTQLKGKLDAPAHGLSSGELKYRKRVKQVESVLKGLQEVVPGDWVEEHSPDRYEFKILNPAPHAERLLFQGAEKVVLTSATLTDKTMALLGIQPHQVTMWEAPSHFPVDRRRVWFIPTVRVDFKSMQIPANQTAWISRIDQIVNVYGNYKGIIHSVSHKRADQIYNRSHNRDRMVDPGTGTTAEKVDQFRTSDDPAILVSPSVVTGYDFPGDQCRFQIIAKLPFPDSKSAVLKARAELDPDYLPYLMIQSLVQAVGRGMRFPSDWCWSFIVDDHWVWVRGKYAHLMPGWFKAAVDQSMTIPGLPGFK